jgi:proline iminopeptidase
MKRVLPLVAVAAAATVLAAEIKTGGARMIQVDGKYHVWTDRVGNGPVTMLTLHGGPGFPHDYLECFEDFLPQHGVQFYYYDQLGAGRSDHPDDDALWTIERYRDEVEQVRRGLGLDRFYLYGHSWGTMLAIEYALAHQDHLKALILSDMTAGIREYEAYAQELLAELPEADRATLARFQAAGQYDAPEYQAIMFGKVYAEHLVRIDPWPEPVARAFNQLNARIYNVMQGPNEFVISGNLKDWSRWDDLDRIRVPTLLVAGEKGTMNPEDIRRMGKLIPRSRVVLTSGSHLDMYDAQDEYFAAIVKFIEDVEKGRFE